MYAYFMIVLIAIVLFFVVWFLGWLLEKLSHTALNVTRKPGSRAWYALVGPGVALHESSHALGCVLTRTEIVEFKPINVSVQEDHVILGYVKYVNPDSTLKRTIINLAPVGVSLILLTFFALFATYLIPDSHLGGEALTLLQDLIGAKANPDMYYPLTAIGSFVYNFFYTFAGLTVINPIFWIVAFLAMTIMFSNAPSDVDISNALPGLKFLLLFEIIWLVIAALIPDAGWLLYGVFELAAVMFALALGFSALAYGFFIMITSMGRLKTPVNLLPFISTIIAGLILSAYTTFTPAFQTIISVAVFVIVVVPLLMVKSLRAES
ncbi:MAG: hypothetical protein KAR33_03380 [Candidatus Thorarchaeota archaeon]|nr:hypothetical protein [Candidatus Thorarchaeota archaeon]